MILFNKKRHQLGIYWWRPEVVPLPVWDKLETKLQSLKIEIEYEQATAIFCPSTSVLFTNEFCGRRLHLLGGKRRFGFGFQLRTY